jgi:hypothetical protein
MVALRLFNLPLFPMVYRMGITNLTCDELIMKIVQSSFIHKFVHFLYEYHALKTHLTHG